MTFQEELNNRYAHLTDVDFNFFLAGDIKGSTEELCEEALEILKAMDAGELPESDVMDLTYRSKETI